MSRKIILATNNADKVREFQALLARCEVSIFTNRDFNLDPPAETGLTFVENALLKARYASLHSGLPAIADDSGLSVNYLRGAPGIYSARYAGENASAAEKNQKLLTEMLSACESERSAFYTCALVYLDYPEDPVPLIAQCMWYGRIAKQPQGEGGFGYDPLFYLPEFSCTVAELSAEKKNTISHRAQAMKSLLNQLQQKWQS